MVESLQKKEREGIYDTYYDQSKGDFTLISSDGISFGVERFHLQSASVVLRDMLTVGLDSSSLEMTDEIIEDADTFRLFLDVIFGRDQEPPSESTLEHLKNALSFTKKYDCPGVHKSLRTRLALFIVPRRWLIKVFILAAQYDDYHTGHLVLAKSLFLAWDKDSGGKNNLQEEYPGYFMDLHFWPLEQAKQIPIEWHLAFSRAKHIATKGQDTREGREELASKFLQLLDDNNTRQKNK